MSEILQTLSSYPIRTRLSLSGTLVVARDIAHAKLQERINSGKGLPQYIKDHPVYYAGPAKTPEVSTEIKVISTIIGVFPQKLIFRNSAFNSEKCSCGKVQETDYWETDYLQEMVYHNHLWSWLLPGKINITLLWKHNRIMIKSFSHLNQGNISA